MKTQVRHVLPDEARAALTHLWRAYAYARDLKVDPWEFAQRLTHLVELGVGETDLRWLVLNGYVDHADELTTFSDPNRRFQPHVNVAFTCETCFVLTEAGASVVDAGDEDADSPPGSAASAPDIVSFQTCLPRWDRNGRVLMFDGCVVKRFRVPAINQEAVLSAFEEESWPRSIDDPLPYVLQQRPKERLHATIRSLNANHENRLIRFRGNGTGEAVIWERIAASAVDLPPVRLGRAA